MQFRVLGPLEVDAGDGPLPLGGPKQRAVLANLLIRANEVVPADTLIDDVWGDDPPEKARNTLQTYVSNLRRTLGDGRLEGRAPGYMLVVEPTDLDITRFDGLVREAKRVLVSEPEVAVETLAGALALWRGPALADIADRGSLLAEAARLDELRLEALEDRAHALIASDDPARAAGELEPLVARHPLRERLWELLMLARYRMGRQADALGAFQRAREILADELGIDPSPELVRLHERILRQDPGLELRGRPLRGYRLLERIDDGPGGARFRAIQPHVDRDVVVRIVDERLSSDQTFVQRFERDGQAVAALEHPNLVSVQDFWREPGHAYVVSRFLRGGTLGRRLVGAEPFGTEPALRLVDQIASALAVMHDHGLAHGDVDAAHVWFDAEGNGYLADPAIGTAATVEQDLVALVALVRTLVPSTKPAALRELVERADDAAPEAAVVARAARAALGLAEPAERLVEARNPYKGLRAFAEPDAGDFFGRDDVVRRLSARLHENVPGSRFLAVVGASGAGKSSIVRAGLVPVLRQAASVAGGTLYVADLAPGARPLDELELALQRIAVRPAARLRDRLDAGPRGLIDAVDLVVPDGAEILLIVDQLEEAFTLTRDPHERSAFLDALRVAAAEPDGRIRVVVTLRADFYDRPLGEPRFGELLAARTEAIPPLTPDEVELAIVAPAERVGASFETGLVGEIVSDVVHQPGSLPLLEYALTELFERREEGRMRLGPYREMGGVAGTLASRADRLVDAMDDHDVPVVRQLFLRLVTLGEGRHDTRRRVARVELDALDAEPEEIDGMLATFGRHRILTFDREPTTRERTVEIAHEALLLAWGRLRGWIDEAREDLRQERRLANAGLDWRVGDRDPSFLLRGSRLEQVETWADRTDLAITTDARRYLKASIDERDRERERERAQRERESRLERRSIRRLRALVAVFGAAALVAGTLTIVATHERGLASAQTRIATARELANAALANIPVDPERAILLAVEAVRTTRSVDGTVLREAVEALHRAIAASRAVMTTDELGGAVAWADDRRFAAEVAGEPGVVEIRDALDGSTLSSIHAHVGDVTEIRFASRGRLLVTAGKDGAVRVWDAATGTRVAEFDGRGPVAGLSVAGSGSLVSGVWYREHRLRVFDVSSGEVVMDVATEAGDASIAPDGEAIALAMPPGAMVFTVPSGRALLGPLRPSSSNDEEYGIADLAWSPDGARIATVGLGGLDVWDAVDGRLLSFGQQGWSGSVAWSGDGRHLVTGSQALIVWRVDDLGAAEEVRLTSLATRDGIADRGVAVTQDGSSVIASAATRNAVTVWDTGTGGDAEWAHFHSVPYFGRVEFLPDGRLIAGTSPDGDLVIRDVSTGTSSAAVGSLYREASFDASPDGRDLLVMDANRSAMVDLGTGEERFQTPFGWLAWDEDGGRFAAADGATIHVFDRDGRELTSFSDPDGRSVLEARFGRGDTLVVEREGAGLEVWDVASGDLVRTLPTGRAVEYAALDVDGAVGALGGAQPSLWDVETGRRIADLEGRPSVCDFEFSPDGSIVATGGGDYTIRLFDAHTGEELLVLATHQAVVCALSFSPDGSMLAAQSPGDVRVYALDLDDLLALARRNVTRSLTDEECRTYLALARCAAD